MRWCPRTTNSWSRSAALVAALLIVLAVLCLVEAPDGLGDHGLATGACAVPAMTPLVGTLLTTLVAAGTVFADRTAHAVDVLLRRTDRPPEPFSLA